MNTVVSIYSPRSVTICKTPTSSKHQVRLNQRARREYIHILRGLSVRTDTQFLTMTSGRGDDFQLRAGPWHNLLTRMRQRWPNVEAVTVFEDSDRRGVHLHAGVRNVPGFSSEWLDHVVAHLGDGVSVHAKPVWDAAGLAHYLTKSLADPAAMAAWPRNFHITSYTRGWAPGWLSRRKWMEQRRAPLMRRARALRGRWVPRRPAG